MHLAAENPEGIYVAKDSHLASYLRREYRNIISPDRIVDATKLDYPEKFRGMGSSPLKEIYIDDIPSGFEIPNLWMSSYHIKAIAVQPKSSFENEYLPDSYLEAVIKMEKERRDQKKSPEVDKTPPTYDTIVTDRSS